VRTRHILTLSSKRQALIEFDNQQSSVNAMAAVSAALITSFNPLIAVTQPAIRICGATVDVSYGGTGQLNPDGMSKLIPLTSP
jgi:hypothetical protein